MARLIDNRKDILLLMLFSPGKEDSINEPINGRTRLTKMLYLFKKEALKKFRKGTKINEKNFYEFFAWNFGPFSRDVYDDLTFFELRGFIQKNATEGETYPEAAAEWDRWLDMSSSDTDDELLSEYDEAEFSLTTKGVEFTETLYESLSIEQKKLLKTFKSKLVTSPLRAILQYVYSAYPESTTKSQIKEQVLGSNH